ncbi:MAG: hypothetical protein Q4G13_02685 [Moraxella sp.]|nr:hypothetical protein [Moraxella sp.]
MSFIVKNLADRITINLRFFLERRAIYLIFIYKDEMSADPKKWLTLSFLCNVILRDVILYDECPVRPNTPLSVFLKMPVFILFFNLKR